MKQLDVNFFQRLFSDLGIWLTKSQPNLILILRNSENTSAMRYHYPFIEFNTSIYDNYGFDYFITIFIHELVHVLRQKIATVDDVRMLRSKFSEAHMARLDAEADLQTYIYLHQNFGWDIVRFNSALFSGKSLFGNADYKEYYLNRMISTMIALEQFDQAKGVEIIEFSTEALLMEDKIYYLSSKNGRYGIIELINEEKSMLIDVFKYNFESTKEYCLNRKIMSQIILEKIEKTYLTYSSKK